MGSKLVLCRYLGVIRTNRRHCFSAKLKMQLSFLSFQHPISPLLAPVYHESVPALRFPGKPIFNLRSESDFAPKSSAAPHAL